MGLDNGIRVMNLKKENIPSFIELPMDQSQEGNIEIAYWRKCWGIRDAILDVLSPTGENDDGIYDIEAEDIPAILRELKRFFFPDYWEEYGRSIWEYAEIFENLFRSYLNLSWLYKYMEENPEIECYFYDSY